LVLTDSSICFDRVGSSKNVVLMLMFCIFRNY